MVDVARQPRVTQAEVDAIAEEMVAAGIRPGTIAVRKRLGRGSNSTLGDALADWRQRKADAASPRITVALPDVVAKAVAEYIEAQIDQYRKAGAERLAAEETARQAAAAQADQLEGDVQTLTTQLELLREQRDQAVGRLQQLQEDSAAERGRLTAEAKAADGRAHAADLDVASLKAKLEAAFERANAAEAREHEARSELRATKP